MTCGKDASPMRAVLVTEDFALYQCVASAHSVRVGAAAPLRLSGTAGVAHDPLLAALRDHGKYGAERRCHDCPRVAVPGETRCGKHKYAKRKRA